MHSEKSFNSKVLLFGEYSVIRESMALCIPYRLFDGRLAFRRDHGGQVDGELKEFSKYLKTLKKSDELFFDFDINSFDFDIGQGLHFDSSIPQGHGVGSSGALCAAIFDRYSKEGQSPKNDIMYLKRIFSLMESHFHGASSGVDPLISYINRPIIINRKEVLEVSLPHFSEGPGAIFLLNSGRARRTEPLVNLFLEKCKSDSYADICDSVLTPITNHCVNSFLEGDMSSLFGHFRELSDFQYRHFLPMIPKLFRDLWMDALKDEQFYLKICGAGGGGFLLGMTSNFESTCESLAGYELRPLIRF